MRETLARVLAGTGASFAERDVREDPELERRYLFDIPVLLLAGRELVRHRASEAELREILAAAGVLRAR